MNRLIASLNRMKFFSHPLLPLFAFAAIKFFLHLAVINRYGYFRDELYYIVCSENLSWGYVDQPPLSIFILKLFRLVLGDSLPAIRLPAALAGAACVFLTGLLAREMGGGRFAQAFAALSALAVPLYFGIHKFFSMNAFETVFWPLVLWQLLRLFRKPFPAPLADWGLIGLVLGLGLLNKVSVLFLGAGLGAGLLLTKERRNMLTPGPYVCAALAGAIFAPHLIWQIQNEWPTLEFMENARNFKNTPVSPLEFLFGQILEVHPLLAPLWATGLGALLFSKRLAEFRFAGIVFLFLYAFFSVTRGKAYYLAPAYPPLFAAGAVFLASTGLLTVRKWIGWAFVAVLTLAGAVTAPMGLPLLPVRSYLAYQAWLGLAPPADERGHTGALPQHFADMFGWEELANAVERAYRALPDADRETVALFGRNYGDAAAVEFFGRARGLPVPRSGHNNYFLRGPGQTDFTAALAWGFREDELNKYFSEVRPAATAACEFCPPERRRTVVFLCRGLKIPFAEAWRTLKIFI